MSNHQTILHVEDTPEDVFLLQYAFTRAEITNPMQVAANGQEAIDYLTGAGKYADRQKFPLPGLVLLDLKLPIKMGLEVLEWIRSQPAFKSLVVIVLSSSIYEGDIKRAYELGANAFLVKPSDTHVTLDMCKAFKHFWLQHNQPPFSSPEMRRV
jgi:two-component system response regulator